MQFRSGSTKFAPRESFRTNIEFPSKLPPRATLSRPRDKLPPRPSLPPDTPPKKPYLSQVERPPSGLVFDRPPLQPRKGPEANGAELLKRSRTELFIKPQDYDENSSVATLVFPPLNMPKGKTGARPPPPLSLFNGAPSKTISLPNARSSVFQFNSGSAIYAVNTTNGLIRSYNEDRVSIVINVKRKADWKQKRWPNCSFFSIFDGHGGAACADFLMDNLHRFILENANFPEDVPRAISEGCTQAENEFCKFALKQTNVEKSGSCALILVIVDNRVYVGNVGDSRAFVSRLNGKSIFALSKDHKPEDPAENERILKAGGAVSKSAGGINPKLLPPALAARVGELPFRIYPGGLSVSRSFGDVTAKDAQFGGNPLALIAKPDITVYKIEEGVDFILMACDGVFDKFSSKKLGEAITKFVEERSGFGESVEKRLKTAEETVDFVLLESIKKLSYDNLTAILIAFNG